MEIRPHGRALRAALDRPHRHHGHSFGPVTLCRSSVFRDLRLVEPATGQQIQEGFSQKVVVRAGGKRHPLGEPAALAASNTHSNALVLLRERRIELQPRGYPR
jgi:hypothetical protein